MILSYRITVILLRIFTISIEAIDVELIRIEEDHKDSIDKLVDSIQQYADSITLNLDIRVDENTDSIKELADSISDLDNSLSGEIDLLRHEKVDRVRWYHDRWTCVWPLMVLLEHKTDRTYTQKRQKHSINTPLNL